MPSYLNYLSTTEISSIPCRPTYNHPFLATTGLSCPVVPPPCETDPLLPLPRLTPSLPSHQEISHLTNKANRPFSFLIGKDLMPNEALHRVGPSAWVGGSVVRGLFCGFIYLCGTCMYLSSISRFTLCAFLVVYACGTAERRRPIRRWLEGFCLRSEITSAEGFIGRLLMVRWQDSSSLQVWMYIGIGSGHMFLNGRRVCVCGEIRAIQQRLFACALVSLLPTTYIRYPRLKGPRLFLGKVKASLDEED